MARFAPSYRDAPKEACKVAEIDRSEPVELTLVLKPAKPPQPHAYTGKPLSRAEYNKAYASDPAAIERIRKFAAQHGMTVMQGDSPHQVRLRGTLGLAIDAFQPEAIGIYDGPHGRFRARAGHLSVPDDIAGDLVAVMGFDRRPVAKPHFRPRTGAGTSYTPPQVAERYGFPTNVTGAGQTIAIIELGGGYTDSEMAVYFNSLGVQRTGKLTAISVDNASNAPGDPNGADGEVQLDIEVAGSVASGADLAVYFGPNEASGFLDAISAAINDQTNNPSVMSISWGGPESTYAQQDLQAYDLAFAHAATIGITVCVASGDNGASDGESSGKHVDFPASSPHVLGCGGTRLPPTGQEVAWNDGPQGGASGGGYSIHFTKPDWQTGNTKPHRGIPDVAGDADPQTGYKVSVDGRDTVIGGTSAVAPLWAALFALVNQSRGTRVGLANPALYAAEKTAFTDITEGNNDGFEAGPGWDPVTGLGSPKGPGVLAALSVSVPAA
jgi:kumamolisin